jgi:glutamine synthetase
MHSKNILEKIKKENIDFVDFRFTDSKGKNFQTSYIASEVNEELLEQGVMFDGSSINGWKEINESDMILKPDLKTFFIDPFAEKKALVLFTDVFDPKTNKCYNRDPRSTAKKAEDFLIETGIADQAFFGPEIEFFVFDYVDYKSSPYESYINLNSNEINNSGNGYHTEKKQGYCSVPSQDAFYDMRAEMILTLKEAGLKPILHHHEVASSQLELGFTYDNLTASADNCLKYKYIVRRIANKYGKTVTFMPKPIFGDNGSGMHVHQSLWKNGTPLFLGGNYAGISETCLYYIGGIIKHAKAINAFTNPTTNSYKRLVPGYEAPVLLAYSSCNRSASIRLPHVINPKAKRIEVRFPDPLANPYYAFSAMLMAGLDGILNKIHPGEAIDKNLYELSKKELDKIPSVSKSLEESLEALNQDRSFLKTGQVFNDDQIDSYIKLKTEENNSIINVPTPTEFKEYYNF